MDDLTLPILIYGLMLYAVFVIALTIHEAAHAVAAWKLGDPTAYEAGQVTLNPWPHMRRSPIGTILVPWISFLLFQSIIGWASAPYDPTWGERYPGRKLLMALAGPLANFLQALFAFVAMRALLQTGHAQVTDFLVHNPYQLLMEPGHPPGSRFFGLFEMVLQLNVLLFFFNLMPFPPLDGAAIWKLVLPAPIYRRYQDFAYDPNFMMLGVIVASAVANRVLPGLYGQVTSALLWNLTIS